MRTQADLGNAQPTQRRPHNQQKRVEPHPRREMLLNTLSNLSDGFKGYFRLTPHLGSKPRSAWNQHRGDKKASNKHEAATLGALSLPLPTQKMKMNTEYQKRYLYKKMKIRRPFLTVERPKVFLVIYHLLTLPKASGPRSTG